MLKTLNIQGFRGIESLPLDDLGHVNIFIGSNGAGKTSVLEAIHLMARPSLGALGSQGMWREMPPLTVNSDDAVRTVFPGMDVNRSINLEFEADSEKRRLTIAAVIGLSQVVQTSASPPEALTPLASADAGDLIGVKLLLDRGGVNVVDIDLQLMPNGFMEHVRKSEVLGPGAFFIHARRSTSAAETSNALTRLYQSKTQEDFLEAARRVDERVRTMVPGSRGNMPVVLVDVGGPQMIPMNVLGDGFCRIALMLTGIVFAPGMVVLVDEIDSGLHHTVMESFWRSIVELSKHYKFQLFCTTHSEEMLRHSIEAFADAPDYLRVFRLDRVRDTGEVTAQKYTFDMLRKAEIAGLDIR